MRRLPIPAFAFIATTALSSCGVPIPLLPGAPRPTAPTPTNVAVLSPQEREKLRAVGGDELVSDTDFANAAPGRDGMNLQACVSDYARGLLEPEARTGLRIRDFKDCTTTCNIAAGGAFANTAKKYHAKCTEKLAENMAQQELKYARIAMDNLRQSGSPVGWYRNLVDARVSLDRSREKVGPDLPELKEMYAEYDRLLAAHRKELKAGQAFLERPDIADMLSQEKVLDGELSDLKARYEKTHRESTANLIRIKKERREELETYFQTEGRKAGVLK